MFFCFLLSSVLIKYVHIKLNADAGKVGNGYVAVLVELEVVLNEVIGKNGFLCAVFKNISVGNCCDKLEGCTDKDTGLECVGNKLFAAEPLQFCVRHGEQGSCRHPCKRR